MRNILMEMIANYYLRNYSNDYADGSIKKDEQTISMFFCKMKNGDLFYTSSSHNIEEVKNKISICYETYIKNGKIIINRIDDNISISNE